MRRTLAAATIAGLILLAGAVGIAQGAPTAANVSAGVASAPVAGGPVIASLVADSPIAAGGGWVLWSVPAAGGWALEGWHGGVTRPLAVSPRSQPFDVNVGSSAAGRSVAAFSRCAKAPQGPGIGLGFLAPLTGSGCRVHVLDLTNQRETAPAIPHPRGTSDTTPSMWRGRIAFARLDPVHHASVQQVLLWTPGRPLRTLPHGALPSKCGLAGGCAGQPRTGSVQGLAYDGRLVSFLWQPVAPGVSGQVAWEVRADVVATGASRVVGDGIAGEVCTGGADLSAPSPPVLSGFTVRFASLQSTCYVFNSVLSLVNTTRSGNGFYAALPGVVLGLAQDGGQLYALEAPAPSTQNNPTCTAGAPCEIQRIPAPAPLKPEPHRPTSPFF